jgi:hypothetical protein
VAPESRIELIPGENAGFKICRYLLYFTALYSLLLADVMPTWKYAAITGLGITLLLVRKSVKHRSLIKKLHLFPNGQSLLYLSDLGVIPAMAGHSAWSSGWLCVVSLRPLHRHGCIRLLVCKSRQHPDDYRRLLEMLRMGSGLRNGNGIIEGV